MSQLLSPQKVKEQERMVRVLQGMTFGLYAFSLTLSCAPMFIKMDRALNFFLLGMSPVIAYAGVESSHKLRLKEKNYIIAKNLLDEAIQGEYSAEITKVKAVREHKLQNFFDLLDPEQQQHHQLPSAHPGHAPELPPSHGQPGQVAGAIVTQQQQAQQQPEIEYGPALVQSLAAHKLTVALEAKLEGSSFDRYLLSKQDQNTTFAKIKKLGQELQLDLGLKAQPLISIYQGFIAVDIPRAIRRIFRYEDYIKPGVKPSEDGLWLPIGMPLGGRLVEVDLSQPDACHILGGGITGSGKSVWLQVAVKSLCDRYSPEEVQLILCDFGKASFGCFEGDPHLMIPVLKDIDDIIQVLELLVKEMDRRKDLLDEYAVPHLTALNKLLPKPLARLVNFTDEYAAEIEACTPDQRKIIESLMIRLSLEARKTGIHLLTFMQRPEEAYLDGQVRSNHPASVCLKVARIEDSKMVLGEAGLGGEQLLGQGDLLFKCGGEVQRLQSLFWEPAGNAQPKPSQPAYTTVAESAHHAEEMGGEYAYRYPPNWKEISREAKLLTGTMCCFPGCTHEATETHHAQYMREINGQLYNICDDPEPGEDTFPLCDEHHKNRSNPDCAHHPSNWVYGTCESPRQIDSHNTEDYHRKLRKGFAEKTARFEKFLRAKLAA